MSIEFPKSEKPLAFSYIRMSTAIQLKGDSLRRQKDLSRSYAEEFGLHLVENFKLEDIGLSAFKGENSQKGALKYFLDAVEDLIIPKGSYLLVESLDRLSREKVAAALSSFLSLQQAGINIVTLSDRQIYMANEQNMQSLIYSITIMSRAYEESEIKSRRLTAAWENKRNKADEIKLTKLAPAWLRLSKDKQCFDVIVEKAAIVKKIFALSQSGMGSYSIVRQLNDEGIQPFGKSVLWAVYSVTKILQNRAVLGEFQPHTNDEGSRVPIGEPLKEYFPQIIDTDLFLFVQLNRSKRRLSGKGRKGNNLPNLFTNLAICMHCKSPMHFINKGKGSKGGTYLKCSKSIKCNSCSPAMWRYCDFEASFLFFCKEINWVNAVTANSMESSRLSLQKKRNEAELKLEALHLERDRVVNLVRKLQFTGSYYTDQVSLVQKDIEDAEMLLIDYQDELSLVNTTNVKSEIPHEDQIKKFQFGENQTFQQRLLLKELLGRVVKSLEICPASPEEKDQLLYRTLLASSTSEKDKQYMEEYIASIIENEKDIIRDKGKSFKVKLSDGTQKLIYINPDNPLDFEKIVEMTSENRSFYRKTPRETDIFGND